MWSWFSRRRTDEDFKEEIRANITLDADQRIADGISPEGANAAARRAFGNVTHAQERFYDSGSMRYLDALSRDLQYAARTLIRSPWFSVVTLLTLALGMSGATIAFSVAHGILLKPLPVPDQDRVLVAWKTLPSAALAHAPFRASEIDVIRRESHLFEGVAGVSYYGAFELVAVERDVATSIHSAPVTGDFFQVLGVKPLLGRVLTREDDRIAAAQVIVVSYGFWQRQYGGASDIVGRQLTINRRPVTIIGVMPRDVEYPAGAEAWMALAPFASTMTAPDFAEGVSREVDIIGRLRPSVTLTQATDELKRLMPALDALVPAGYLRGTSIVVRSYLDAIVGDVRATVLLLCAAVGLVLLVAGANAATLLLMRGHQRRGEWALRSALGASRGALTRQLMVESLVLAGVAGLLAVFVTTWSLPLLREMVPGGLPRAASVRVDMSVWLFAVGATLLTSVLTGLAPTMAIGRANPVQHLRSSRASSGRDARQGTRTLVVIQIAVTVVVVAATGLLARSLWRLETVDLGFDGDRLTLVTLTVPPGKYADRSRHLQFLQDLMGRIQGVPGIAAVTPVNALPFSGTNGWELPQFTAEGQDTGQIVANPSLNLEAIHPNYFETFHVPLVSGRAFTTADREGALEVVLVSADLAARLWPGQDPIGKRLKFGNLAFDSPWRTVVGVAAGTRYRDLRTARPTLYIPAEQFLVTAQTLAVRAASPGAAVGRIIRDQVHAVDPDVQVTHIGRFAEWQDEPLMRPRLHASAMTIFGVSALVLASVGLYAVIAASVRQRRTEIGIRLALGATPTDIRRVVLSEGLRLSGAGVLVGLTLALVATRSLAGLLYEVQPLDAGVWAITALVVMSAALVISYLPARNAMRVDPVAVLRDE